MISWLWSWVSFAARWVLATTLAALMLYICLSELAEVLLAAQCAAGTFAGPRWLGSVLCWLFELSAALRAPYVTVRARVLAHPIVTVMLIASLSGAGYLIRRRWTVFWNNEVMARLRGTYLKAARYWLPRKRVHFEKEVRKTTPGQTFVGLEPYKKHGLWWYRRVYLSNKERSFHRHVMGKTGSGKTMGVIWSGIVQDMRAGHGVLFMDAKGSDESARMFVAEATKAGRLKDVRIVSLPALNRSDLFSHTWSLTAVGKNGDPLVTAERLLSILEVGDNQYYFGQAKVAVRCLCRVLHGIDLGLFDQRGQGTPLPFIVNDIIRLLLAAGHDDSDPDYRLLKACLKLTTDQAAAERLRAQLTDLRAKGKVAETFCGLTAALEDFSSHLVNARFPDVVFEDALEQGLLIYVQLPANLFPLQAKAFGRAILKDFQQAASLRQVESKTRSQKPFAVYIDEFYNFADLIIIDGLNKLRDANIWYTLSHQSPADLEFVSPQFAQAVQDNTRNKDILAQDNPDLCERIAKSLGTFQEVHKTVRHAEGPFATSVATGDASAQLGETLKLHPNAIKNLKPVGQGYQRTIDGIRPVIYPELKPPEGYVELRLNRMSQPEGDVLGRVADAFARIEAKRVMGTEKPEPSAASRRAAAAASMLTVDQQRSEARPAPTRARSDERSAVRPPLPKRTLPYERYPRHSERQSGERSAAQRRPKTSEGEDS